MEVLPWCVLFGRDIGHGSAFCTSIPHDRLRNPTPTLAAVQLRYLGKWLLVAHRTAIALSIRDAHSLNIEQTTVKIEASRDTKKRTPLLQPGIRSHEEKTDLVFCERQARAKRAGGRENTDGEIALAGQQVDIGVIAVSQFCDQRAV